MSQKDFWEDHIVEWEASAYEGRGGGGLLERVASHFRGPLQVRQDMACDLLRDISPTSLLELGCGQGRLLLKALQMGWAQRGTGVDISSLAIEHAKRGAREIGLPEERVEFHAAAVADVDPAWIDRADCVIGLGLIQYLTDQEYDVLFGRLKGKTFLFDWHGKELSVINMMHAVYRLLRRFPFYRRFSEREIRDLLTEYGFDRPEMHGHGGIHIFVVRP